MRAVVANNLTPSKTTTKLTRIIEAPIPKPSPHEVLIKAKAAGVNNADLLQCQGFYPPPAGVTPILGLEIAGEVVATGEKVSEYVIGDEVGALLSGGGYAEYVSVNENLLVKKPKSLELTDLAGLLETCCTVWANLGTHQNWLSEKLILIHGGAGGIGSIAIQLAKYFGATVITTVSSSAKLAYARKLGADYLINYRETDFTATTFGIAKKLHLSGVDMIFDIIGAKYFTSHVKLLNTYGKLIIIGLQGGTLSEINLAEALTKNLSVTGFTLRNRPLHGVHGKTKIVQEVKQHVLPLFSIGKIIKPATKFFDLEDAEVALKFLAERKNLGKIILQIN